MLKRRISTMARVGVVLASGCLGLGLALGVVPGVSQPRVASAQASARAWFGVEVAERKDGRGGVLVKHVSRTSPADAAGIKDGDGLLKIGERSVSAPGEVVGEIRSHKPGDVLDVVFERGGNEQKAKVTLAVFPAPEEMLRRERVGTFAPAISGLVGVQGALPANLGALKGKVVILDFWAGWCGVCKMITPILNGWSDKMGAQGLVVVGISSDDVKTATKAIGDFGIKYAVGADPEGKTFGTYGVTALPTMFLLDKKGVVRQVDVGFDADGMHKTEAQIQALLAEPAPLVGRSSVLRVLDEFLWTLRRRGIAISPTQAMDVMRAVALIGFGDKETLRDAMCAIVVQRREDLRKVSALFDRFFAAESTHGRDLYGRLRAAGFEENVLAGLREMLETIALGDPSDEAAALLTVLLGGAPFDHRLVSAELRRSLEGLTNPLQAGFFSQRAFSAMGIPKAARELAKLRVAFAGAFGAEVAERLIAALSQEIEIARGEVRAFVEGSLQGGEPIAEGDRAAEDVPFTSLSDHGVVEVRRAIRILAERLRGAARVREKHGKRGRIDVGTTMRRAMRTGGVPFSPARRMRRRDKPRLLLLCDVSDSVRTAAVFLLEFLSVAQDLFERTRTFVFVSDLGETTTLFEELPLANALGEIFRGRIVNLAHNSNYGRVLRQLEERHLRAIDRQTTVVILGDGRTNYQPPELEILQTIKARARAVLWLCPEPRGTWGVGDSAMPRYAKVVTAVLEASTAQELEVAARRLLAQR